MSQTEQTTSAEPLELSAAIFSSRETPQALLRTIEATINSVWCERACIDVVINGNKLLAENIASILAQHATSDANHPTRILRVWFVEMGDKAHAWNEYIQRIWPKSELAYFIDGFARPHPDALENIAKGLFSDLKALAGTSVPTLGLSARSQREMLKREGGLQGNVFAIRGNVLQKLVDSGFRLPRGIYRNDSLIGAVLLFNLDPAHYDWDPSRIHIAWDAHWDYDTLKWWRPKDWLTQYRRRNRQMQGVFENAAIRQWLAIEKKPPFYFPLTAAELVSDWMKHHPNDAQRIIESRRGNKVALERLLTPRDWSSSDIPTVLLCHIVISK
jgi:hypothetical protein